MADIVQPQPIAAVTLPDGRVAAILREPKGRDAETVTAILGPDKLTNPISFTLVLFAQVGVIADAPVLYEDLREMSFGDVNKITAMMGAFLGNQ